MKRKRLFMLLVTVVLLGALSTSAAIYPAYTYSFKYGSASPCPAPYNAQSILSGTDMNLTPLSNSQDLFFDQNTNRLLIADTGNSRVILYNTAPGRQKSSPLFWMNRGRNRPWLSPRGSIAIQMGISPLRIPAINELWF